MNILRSRRSALARCSICTLFGALSASAVQADAIGRARTASWTPVLHVAQAETSVPDDPATDEATGQERAPPKRMPPPVAPVTPISPQGQAQQNSRPPPIAPIFEQPGVLTPKGTYVVEPSIQFGYSSSNRVALVGYTVIPAILIGLVDVREIKRNTLTGAVTARYGLTNRLEVEARVPYVYRTDATVSREIFKGSSTEAVFDASGKSVGDAELAARYQFNDTSIDNPFYFVGTLRFKSRTGKDPFEVVTDCATRCVGNTTGTGLPLSLPTGSGFYSLQPGVTWLYPSDPAVFFGSFTYLHNFKRSNVSRKVINGEEALGTITPGDIFGFNFGMGLALNEKSSFSIGYDHSSIGRTQQNDVTVPGSVRTQLGTLLLGYSFRVTPKASLSLSVGAGLTRDTPDVTLTARLPISF